MQKEEEDGVIPKPRVFSSGARDLGRTIGPEASLCHEIPSLCSSGWILRFA
jgi:hypothetical protein